MGKAGFTLVELVTIVIIIGILVGLASVNYVGRRQAAIDNEAKAILLLICAAEKDFKQTTGNYVGCGDTEGCNTALGLSIPYGEKQNWVYSINLPGQDNFNATATSRFGPMRVFRTDKLCIVTEGWQIE